MAAAPDPHAGAAGRTPPTRRFRTPMAFLRVFRSDPLGLFESCRREHGDVTGLRAPALRGVLMVGPAQARHVLQENPRNYTKGRIFARLKRFSGNGLLFSEGAFWLRQRRMAAPAFHARAVGAWAGLFAERADALADRLEAADGPLDAARFFADLTLDIVARALFGADVSGHLDLFARNMAQGVEYSNWLVNSLAPPPMWVPTRRNRAMRRAMGQLDAFLADAVARRRADPGRGDPDAAPNLLDMLMDARDDETDEAMTDRQLLDECITFISAGHETTAMGLTWATALLSAHPEVEARLHAEVDAVLGGRRPRLEDVPALPFTRRVVDETLRLYPPGWVLGREAVEDDVVDGWRVEAGAAVFLSPWVTQRHPDLWEHPERFDPDRFAPERARGRPRFAYYPFGGGARLCIGREFALLEMVLALATLARRLCLRLEGPLPRPLPIFTLRPDGPVPVRAEPRA